MLLLRGCLTSWTLCLLFCKTKWGKEGLGWAQSFLNPDPLSCASVAIFLSVCSEVRKIKVRGFKKSNLFHAKACLLF